MRHHLLSRLCHCHLLQQFFNSKYLQAYVRYCPRRLYDPYAGISSALGGRHAAFQLPEGPEFVFQEEAAAKRRSWGENLQFYTGLGYLGGVYSCTAGSVSDSRL
eukprot:GHUV01027833.1.p1 GENE.GHUV01027833.1~~GHUV01027833.1.p1  ORF type:complete len:104 (+),score=17.01 GHUV01027833.1:547-858(+)